MRSGEERREGIVHKKAREVIERDRSDVEIEERLGNA